MLSFMFLLKNISSSLEGCIIWIDIINYLCIMYNLSFLFSYSYNILGSFKDMGDKMSFVLNILIWMLNKKRFICLWNELNINCVNIYLKDIIDFLNIIVIIGLEKENVFNVEILLFFFNDFIKQVDMIIINLIEDFNVVFQFNWKYFKDLFLRFIEMLDDIFDQFQNIWQYIIVLGKEMQKFLKGIFYSVFGNNFFFNIEIMFSVFFISLKEGDISYLGKLIYNLVNYFVFNLIYNFQNLLEVFLYEILKVVDFSI